MSEGKTTQVPAAGGGGLIGWVIGLAIIIAGMVVAGFVLDAGQVWVVPETQSYVATAGTVDAPTKWVSLATEAGKSAEAA